MTLTHLHPDPDPDPGDDAGQDEPPYEGPAAPSDSGDGDELDSAAAREARRWNRVAGVVLPMVAAVGAVLSWGSLYEAAAGALGAHAPQPFGINLAGAAFPLLVDALILGASARYVAGVKSGRPVGGWRLAAHAGVAGTVLLNAAASPTWSDLPWHVTAPIVWSVLVELVARDVLGELHAHPTRTSGPGEVGRIPVRLWLTTPAESVRVSWRMARTGQTDPAVVRAQTERCAAARDHLATALPGRGYRRMRRQITRRLWAGALDPATLAELIHTHPEPGELHRAVLLTVATVTSPLLAPDAGPMDSASVDLAPLSPDSMGPVQDDESESASPAVPIRQVPVHPVHEARPAQVAVPVAGSGPQSAPTVRAVADLARVVQAVTNGQIHTPITKAKIREHLRCSNPHAGTVNALYQQQNPS